MLQKQLEEDRVLAISVYTLFLCTALVYTLLTLFGFHLIVAIYEGRSIEFLNKIIVGQETHPLEYYFNIATRLLIRFFCIFPFLICLALAVKYCSNKIFHIIITALIFIFSFYLCFESGKRGFNAYDQSIVFDAGYRILNGQIPYKDFVMPYGLAVFAVQAVFFKFFGVSYFSYILCAAAINVLAVACGMLILKRLFPYYRFIWYLGGILTAAWFFPPFGTPWAEQMAFFLSFIAVTAILATLSTKERHSASNSLLLMISGGFAFLSWLGKQNVGLFILPLYILLLIALYMPDLKKTGYSILSFFGGFAGALAVFSLWLVFYSDPKNFVWYCLAIPSIVGKHRLFVKGAATFFKYLFFVEGHMIWSLINLAFVSIAVFVSFLYIRNFKNNKDVWRRLFLSCIICIWFVFFQNIFIYTTNNQPEEGNIFCGVIFAIGTGLLLRLFGFVSASIKNQLSRNIAKAALASAIYMSALSCGFLFIRGLDVSLERYVQEGVVRSKYKRCFSEKRLKGLKWAQPTKTSDGRDVQAKDITDLLDYLRAKNRNFFIFHTFTIFYGLLDVPSPQPFLWFHYGVTHTRYDPYLDKWIVEDLNKNKVEVVIIEENSLARKELSHFPVLKAYIENDFKKTGRIGIFNIYEKTM
ncbi:MAG: hypothetical protein A2Z72_01435 [Omnitrophica bacterium RBG_13_46_9]|nr:MAG: hypothetical protein A2Z72_01435 [Omnitrophica bacterium RBG_13_46_9]